MHEMIILRMGQIKQSCICGILENIKLTSPAKIPAHTSKQICIILQLGGFSTVHNISTGWNVLPARRTHLRYICCYVADVLVPMC